LFTHGDTFVIHTDYVALQFIMCLSLSPAPNSEISLMCEMIWTLYICEQCRMVIPLKSFCSQNTGNFSVSLTEKKKSSKISVVWDVRL